MGRAPARPSDRAGRARGAGARGPLRRVASFLRAPGPVVARGDGLRGPPVGRPCPSRLYRVPARMVAEPSAVRDGPGSSRARRAGAVLGSIETQLHLPVPRAAVE